MEQFRFDPAAAKASIRDPDGALWSVNAHTDADELNRVVAAAFTCGAITRRYPRAHIYVCPYSIRDPEPLLAVDLGCGPALVGRVPSVYGQNESAVKFTVLLLREMTAEANWLASADPDGRALAATAAFDRADALVGAIVRDRWGREWQVREVGEKHGFPTLCGEDYWARLEQVEILRRESGDVRCCLTNADQNVDQGPDRVAG